MQFPFITIAEIFKREGILISRKLLSQWVVRSAMALKPLYSEMLKRVLSSQNIYIDETPVKLWETEKCKQAYMWVVVGGNEANPAYRIYEFKEDRRHDNVLDILKGLPRRSSFRQICSLSEAGRAENHYLVSLF